MFEEIPDKMKALNNWVLWKLVDRNGKKTKIPYQVNGTEAKVHDQYTWNSFDVVCRWFSEGTNYNGIGFVFSKDSGLVGIDFDHVRDRNTNQWNIDEINEALQFKSYVEISPSGDGLHVICLGKKPGKTCKSGNYEMYDDVHYFTITGNVFPGGSKRIVRAQPAINKFYEKFLRNKEKLMPVKANYKYVTKTSTVNNSAILSDDQIVSMCRNAKNSQKFDRLFGGDWSGYPSSSEADFALCRILAFYSSDPVQIERIMQLSGLSREKWKRPGYLTRTVNNAISLTRVMYGN